MKFSERIGITPIRTQLQLDSIDNLLATQLWNIYQIYFIKNLSTSTYEKYHVNIWSNYLNRNIDELPRSSWDSDIHYTSINEILKEQYYKSTWYEKYNFIQFIAEIETTIKKNNHYSKICFIEQVNNCLIKNLSAYRFINGILLPITDEIEISEIESATNNIDKFAFVNIHLETAIKHLGNRENPDYRNSIKESISAVESLCKIIVKDDKATLGKALPILERQYNLHPTLKSAFSSLYGYTSDAGGIRHGLFDKEDEGISFDDAKYLLVICSAFINYVKAKYS